MIAILCWPRRITHMQSLFSNALSRTIFKHIRLSQTRPPAALSAQPAGLTQFRSCRTGGAIKRRGTGRDSPPSSCASSILQLPLLPQRIRGVGMYRRNFLCSLFAAVVVGPGILSNEADAHPGALDRHGCHHVRASGKYICHAGPARRGQRRRFIGWNGGTNKFRARHRR